MELEAKIVNSIRGKALKRHLFCELMDKVDCNYGDLLLHNFKQILPQIKFFLQEMGILYEELENIKWLEDFVFLVDITEKINFLNFYLQGKKQIINMISDVHVVSSKLAYGKIKQRMVISSIIFLHFKKQLIIIILKIITIKSHKYNSTFMI